MSSKIKVDTIENVAGSGNVSLGSGHNLVVPGNITGSSNATVGGTLGITGATTATGGVTIPASTTVGLNFGSGTDLAQLAMQSAVADRVALRTTHTSFGDNNPFIIYQPSSAGAQNDALVINSVGSVTKAKQPAFLATGNNGNYITTSPVPFPTVVYNIGSHYNNSNYTFTAPVAGRYFFHVHMGLLAGGSGNSMYPWFNVNGTQQQYSYANFSTTWYATGHLTCILNLSANDTVKVTVSYSGSTYYNGPNETRFMGYLLG